MHIQRVLFLVTVCCLNHNGAALTCFNCVNTDPTTDCDLKPTVGITPTCTGATCFYGTEYYGTHYLKYRLFVKNRNMVTKMFWLICFRIITLLCPFFYFCPYLKEVSWILTTLHIMVDIVVFQFSAEIKAIIKRFLLAFLLKIVGTEIIIN